MKTTIDIADPLLDEARKLAARDETTLKALVEQGLRKVIAERKERRPFKLRDESFAGDGLQDEFKNATWEQIRAAAYGDRE